MNCRNWEERIALHAQGDLPAPEAAKTERHLADCPDCRQFAESLTQSLALLRAAHDEPLAPAHLAAVRTRVLDRIQTPPRSRRLAWIGAASAAAAALLVFLLIPQPLAPPRLRPVPPPEPPIALAAPPAAVSQLMKPPRRARPKPRLRQPSEPLMVKLETDDPNVVIYWIANQEDVR